jgi:CheY-like chemotaxis protein
MKSGPFNILLVEDNQDHIELINRSFKEVNAVNRLNTVHDGQAAIDYLFHRTPYTDTDKHPRPDVILLDLRMPKLDGLEVLQKIKSDDMLRSIPVIILTSSAADQDIMQAYKNYANSYLVKPVDHENFSKMLLKLEQYWLDWNRYPRV